MAIIPQIYEDAVVALGIEKNGKKIKFSVWKLYFYYYERAIIDTVSIIIAAIAKTATTLIAHLNQVEYSTLARASPPIIAPQVGVIRFTSPLAATNIIIVVSTLKPSSWASGPIIGVERVANPDDDGTSIDSTMCSK